MVILQLLRLKYQQIRCLNMPNSISLDNHLRFHGTLKQCSFNNVFFKALMKPFPLISENDFSMMEEFDCSINAPILVNFHQHYSILENLVNSAFEYLNDIKFILVELSFPGGARLPKALLKENVLLSVYTSDELKKLIEENISCLSIRDSLVRTRNENGNNEIVIDYFFFEENKEVAINKFQKFINNVVLNQFNLISR